MAKYISVANRAVVTKAKFSVHERRRPYFRVCLCVYLWEILCVLELAVVMQVVVDVRMMIMGIKGEGEGEGFDQTNLIIKVDHRNECALQYRHFNDMHLRFAIILFS